MRKLTILALALLASGCWTPGPGERDPTHYPWDPRAKPAPVPAPHPRIEARGLIPRVDYPPEPQPVPRNSSYCLMAIEQESKSGIAVGNVGVVACSAPANPAPTRGPK